MFLWLWGSRHLSSPLLISEASRGAWDFITTHQLLFRVFTEGKPTPFVWCILCLSFSSFTFVSSCCIWWSLTTAAEATFSSFWTSLFLSGLCKTSRRETCSSTLNSLRGTFYYPCSPRRGVWKKDFQEGNRICFSWGDCKGKAECVECLWMCLNTPSEKLLRSFLCLKQTFHCRGE